MEPALKASGDAALAQTAPGQPAAESLKTSTDGTAETLEQN
ncbi:hypothetical protein [Ornithinimicrobium sp. INDO-MA30-4]|nr:hypothetical protein [Ornithinimicrobium sp. INDO-MA30-4]